MLMKWRAHDYTDSSLKQSPGDIAEKYESHFDGNICRCTGYRPIMDAMQHCTDIEVQVIICTSCTVFELIFAQA